MCKMEWREIGRACCLTHVTTVPDSLWAFFGGQIAYMKSRGLDIQAVSSRGNLLDAFAEREQTRVQQISMLRRMSPARDLFAVFQLSRFLQHTRPTIVHGHTPKGGLLAMLAAYFVRTPIRLYHLRGLPLETATGWKRRLLRATERLTCRLAHRVLCNSESLRREAIRWNLCPPEKIRVLHHGSGNGVDSVRRLAPTRFNGVAVREKLGIPPHVPVFGYVGRIARDKGILDLSDAWDQLARLHPELHWLVVGERDSRDGIPEALMKRLKDDPRVHLAGFQFDPAEAYAAMDLCVLPTYREGFPNVLLEAAAMEVPVVATRVTGCVDAVQDGVTGTLVPPRQPEVLQRAISRYLNDPQLRKRHGKAGRKRALRDFRPQDIWEALYEEYVSLLNERGLPVPHPPPPREVRVAA